MKHYYYDANAQRITHEDWPKDYWKHDYNISTSLKEIKKLAVEDMKQQISQLKESLKVVRSLRVGDVKETPKY